jgi:hypothetical protein
MNGIANSEIDDPFVGLEQDNDETNRFVKEANKFCLMAVEDPFVSPRYARILKILESDERIPCVSKMGSTEDGEDELYNLWRDSKVWFKICPVPKFLFSLLSLSLLVHPFLLNTESQRNMEKNDSFVL